MFQDEDIVPRLIIQLSEMVNDEPERQLDEFVTTLDESLSSNSYEKSEWIISTNMPRNRRMTRKNTAEKQKEKVSKQSTAPENQSEDEIAESADNNMLLQAA